MEVDNMPAQPRQPTTQEVEQALAAIERISNYFPITSADVVEDVVNNPVYRLENVGLEEPHPITFDN